MNPSKKMASAIGGAAMAATVVGLTAGLALAAAAPAASGAHLSLCPDFGHPGNYRTTIQGVFPMSEADATGFLIHINDNPQPGGIEYHVLADDEGGYQHDHDIFATFLPHTQTDSTGYLRPGPGGIEYRREFLIPMDKFNEDDGVFDDQDEVYAAATFRDADGGRRQQFSQQIAKDLAAARVCDGCCQ